MNFLIQKEDGALSLDNQILLNLIESEKYIHKADFISLNELKEHCSKVQFCGYIPLGTIEFTNYFLQNVLGVEKQIPIEIPHCLRTFEFLKRRYIMLKKESVPTYGRYFIKDASELKQFSYEGEMQGFDRELLKEDHIYQVSELVKVLSEYRIYFLNGEIQAVCNYNGRADVFPDMDLIKKANTIYSGQDCYPKSYTMDVLVTDAGTCLCECHTLFSTGLYSTVWGTGWLYGYRDSLDYVCGKQQLEAQNGR